MSACSSSPSPFQICLCHQPENHSPSLPTLFSRTIRMSDCLVLGLLVFFRWHLVESRPRYHGVVTILFFSLILQTQNPWAVLDMMVHQVDAWGSSHLCPPPAQVWKAPQLNFISSSSAPSSLLTKSISFAPIQSTTIVINCILRDNNLCLCVFVESHSQG